MDPITNSSAHENETDEADDAARARAHEGSCHCGAVRFSVVVDARKASKCNCSICTKTSALGAIVKPSAFTLLAGADSLSEYVWGHRVSTRYFCKHCGIHCFARGHLQELGGDYVSVNFNALDDVDTADIAVGYWDGRHNNWHGGQRDKPWPIAPRP